MRRRFGRAKTIRPLGTLFSAALVVCLVLLADVEASAEEGTVTAASAPVRIRLGASAGVGLGSMGLAGAASARAGVQITPSLAVSYQITAAATALFDEDSWISHALFFGNCGAGNNVLHWWRPLNRERHGDSTLHLRF